MSLDEDRLSVSYSRPDDDRGGLRHGEHCAERERGLWPTSSGDTNMVFDICFLLRYLWLHPVQITTYKFIVGSA